MGLRKPKIRVKYGSTSEMNQTRRSSGGLIRGAPASRDRARPPGLALLALALVGLAQSGCRSDGCNTCGGFFSRTATNLGNGVQSLGSRVFHHKEAGCSTCGGSEEGVIVDSGVPIVTPGGMAVPAPATIVPAPVDSNPIQLDPIPSTSTQPANPNGNGSSGSSRNLPGNSRSVYETTGARGSIARGRPKAGEISRAHLARPEPVPVPVDLPAGSSDVLERVPPVDLPNDFNRKASATPTSPPTGETSNAPTAPPAEDLSAAGAGSSTLSTGIAVAPRQAPGILRSASVAPSIGGGSAPSLEGLSWLKEKGYKTFIDLRQRSEVEPAYVDSVNDLDMVYISLPIVANRLASARIARFEDLIAQSSHRPIYFCDVDGKRAGLVWYLHLVSVVGEDVNSAAQKAEELGLDAETRRLADNYLGGKNLPSKPGPNRNLALRPAPAPQPSQSGPTVATPKAPDHPGQGAATPPVIPTPEPPLMLPGDSPPAPKPAESSKHTSTDSHEIYREPSNWKAVAAFVLTGLGVPLAYWSKTAISGSRIIRRASLPAGMRRSLNGPASSDV